MTPASPLAARITKKIATDTNLRCQRLEPFVACHSAASALRLSGDPPDSRSGGAVRLNPSRRARCEGARESRGSHAASLNEGLGRVHVQKAAFLVLGFLPRALSQGERSQVRRAYIEARTLERLEVGGTRAVKKGCGRASPNGPRSYSDPVPGLAARTGRA